MNLNKTESIKLPYRTMNRVRAAARKDRRTLTSTLDMLLADGLSARLARKTAGK